VSERFENQFSPYLQFMNVCTFFFFILFYYSSSLCRIRLRTMAIALAIWSLLTTALKKELVGVLNHFGRLSIQEIWGLPRFLLPTILPWIINCSKLYFSGYRIKCPRYWSLRVFYCCHWFQTLFVSTSLLFRYFHYFFWQ